MATPERKLPSTAGAPAGASAALTWEATRSRINLSWPQLKTQLRRPLRTPPIELWVVRHGETTTNAQGLVTGTSDPPLTAEGHRQARNAGYQLDNQHFEIAWYSSLRRSRETLSDIIESGHVRVDSILEEERIRERSLGELELSPARPIPAFACGDLSFAPPGGESYQEVTQRCLSFLLDVSSMALVLNRRTKLLICSHVGLMRILAGILERIQDPAEVLALQYRNSHPKKFEITELEFPSFVTSFHSRRSRATA